MSKKELTQAWLVAFAVSITAFSVVAPVGIADTQSNHFNTRSVQPWYDVLGSGYGCTVVRPNNKLEVRVTTDRSERIARQLVSRKTKVGGQRLSYVRRVDRSQSLVNYLAAWQYAAWSLSSQPTTTLTGPSKWVSSPLGPTSKSRCRSVVVAVYSWPGHQASADETSWANTTAAEYPRNIVTDIRTVDTPPVVPA